MPSNRVKEFKKKIKWVVVIKITLLMYIFIYAEEYL